MNVVCVLGSDFLCFLVFFAVNHGMREPAAHYAGYTGARAYIAVHDGDGEIRCRNPTKHLYYFYYLLLL